MPPKNAAGTKALTLTSNWDQFCDFTSLVGFRLLHSNQPLWVRIIAASVMFLCSFLICFQSLYFWDKFRQSAGQRVATVTETEGQPIRQPRFLLVYNYQMEEKLKPDFIKQLESELSSIGKFLNTTFNATNVLRSSGIALAKKLHLLIEIRAALRNANANSSSNFDQFIGCRMERIAKLYAEFERQQKDYFDYVQNVWMRPHELIVKSIFFENEPGEWEWSWQVDNGLCALGGARKRTQITPEAMSSEQFFDYILVKTNLLESHPNSRIRVYLVYDEATVGDDAGGGGRRNIIKANSIELNSGKHVEVTLRGMSEILDEDCDAKYAPGCVPSNFTYSPTSCRWCKAEVRKACPCTVCPLLLSICNCFQPFQNADLFLAEYIGDTEHNCSLLEVLKCGPIQSELYRTADCPNACVSVEYTADYAVHELTLEMLNTSVGDAVQNQYMAEQLQLVDKINEHKFPNTRGDPWAREGTQTNIWKASGQLSQFLDDYYVMMVTIYRILYGNSFTFPPLFAEDIVGFLGQVPPPNLAPLSRLTELDLAKLELCTGDEHFREAIEQFGNEFLNYFRNNSFKVWYPWYPCPVSISNSNCVMLLNNTDGVVRNIQQLIASSSYRQGTLELALTLNSTPPNPIPIAQFYAEENLQRMENGGGGAGGGNGEGLNCLETKMTLARQLLDGTTAINWPVLAKPSDGRPTNEWFKRFAKFLAQNSGARLLEDFMSSNMALLTVHYRGMTFQRIVYRDDYTLWELLSDVGGVLGLYFGLTLIAVYELAVFALLVDRKEIAKQNA
uniref:Amiloride-sensitive sodium channel n=1 Tax=Globodera pallida TaxID=36090 RepID=A0A183CLB5_GLOPA